MLNKVTFRLFSLSIVLVLSAACHRGTQVHIENGRSMYIECAGNGSPTVVLVSGLGERADNWMASNTSANVFDAVSGFTRVCAYDRPGTTKYVDGVWELSRSTPVATPATVKDSAVDLNSMMVASNESAPYVLVGHSLGGPIIRLFASEHAANVAGLVFVDGLSEYLADGLTVVQIKNFETLNDPAFQGRPPGSENMFYADAVVPLLRAASPVPVVPTVVLSADKLPITPEEIASGALPPFVTQEFADAFWAAQLSAQDKLAALFLGAKHVKNTHASHYIHYDQPQLVIDAIRDVVEQVRAKR